MASAAFATLRAKVQTQLQDTGGSYWTETEIDQYVNDGQLDYCKRTRCYRKFVRTFAHTDNLYYDFPDDFIAPIRFEDEENIPFAYATGDELARVNGSTYRTTEGTPEAVYSDLDGFGTYRFYPKRSDQAMPDPETLGGTEGPIVYMEDYEPGLGEDGVVVDSDDEMAFTGEEGGGVEFYLGDVYPLWYAALPPEDELVIDDDAALKWYALWQAYLKDGDQRNLAKAGQAYAYYNDRVAKEQHRRINGYLAGGIGRPTCVNY